MLYAPQADAIDRSGPTASTPKPVAKVRADKIRTLQKNQARDLQRRPV